MKGNMKTLQEKAQEMLNAFERKERKADNRKFYCLKDDIENHDIFQNICREAHGELMPDDYKYDFIIEALSTIADNSDPEQAINEIEADIYTSDLTAWLNSSNSRVYYLTEILEEYAPITDGFQALMLAQQKEKLEVAFSILESLQNIDF